MDFYRDTEERMRHDVEFASMVNMLTHAAMKNGWTPGELKQLAFAAALRAEMFSVRSIEVPTSVLKENLARAQSELARRGQ